MADTMLSRQAGYRNETVVMAQSVDREGARLDLATLGVRPTDPSKTQSTYRAVMVARPYVTDDSANGLHSVQRCEGRRNRHYAAHSPEQAVDLHITDGPN